MGHREYFVYATKGDNVENLFESISKKIKLNSDNIEEPTITIYCKAEVLKNFSNGIDGLEKGTIGAVISPENITTDELNVLFSEIQGIDFSIFELTQLPEDYEKLFKDSEIKICDKTYFLK